MQHLRLIILILAVLGILALVILAFWGFWFYPVWYGRKKGRQRVACVGDSIVYGMFVPNWFREAWPHQLNRLLKGYQVINFSQNKATAVDGTPKSYSKYRKFRLSLNSSADWLIVGFGTNDSKPDFWQGREKFRNDYTQLLEEYKQKMPASKRILLAPPYAFTETYKIRESYLKEIREEIKQLAEHTGAIYVDLGAFTEEHRDWFVFDGIHPNATGHAKIAELLAGIIKNN